MTPSSRDLRLLLRGRLVPPYPGRDRPTPRRAPSGLPLAPRCKEGPPVNASGRGRAPS
ncbi:hypothetical protein MicB006_0439 [Micromonospora sp. B006]|nr:hypothetical protein MicB006_0439 [Micromonospora sp. B006]